MNSINIISSNITRCFLQRKLKGDAKRREAASKSKPSKTSKKRESSGSDETDAVTSKATKKQRTKSYSKVGSLKPSASSDAAAPTKSRPEPPSRRRIRRILRGVNLQVVLGSTRV